MRVVVLRPEPGAAATVARARALGLDAVAAPLFRTVAIGWRAPDPLPPALLLTSAAAVRLAGPELAALRHLPVYAVGEATAAAARDAGFAAVTAGADDAAAIVARAAADGAGGLLHLAGHDHRAVDGLLPIARRIVYAAEPVGALAVDPAGAVALLHSPRAAAAFAGLAPDRAAVAIAALSPAAAAAAGGGWRALAIAARPTDALLLAAAARLCEEGPEAAGLA